jgi:hypothetical protein
MTVATHGHFASIDIDLDYVVILRDYLVRAVVPSRVYAAKPLVDSVYCIFFPSHYCQFVYVLLNLPFTDIYAAYHSNDNQPNRTKALFGTATVRGASRSYWRSDSTILVRLVHSEAFCVLAVGKRAL